MQKPEWGLELKSDADLVKLTQLIEANIEEKWIGSYSEGYQKEQDDIYTRDMSAGDGQPKLKKVHAFLESHDSDANINTTNELAKYAIIGCGFSATANRLTLNPKDIKGLPIVHIGFPDPWLDYVTHNMNQAVELLTVPGYSKQPELPNEDKNVLPQERWLPSNQFAKCTAEERKRFFSGGDTLHQAGVISIENSEDRAYYKIKLNSSNSSPIIAQKIDILTGTGQQRIIKPGKASRDIQMPYTLWHHYLNPLIYPTPLVVAAEMYVRKASVPDTNGLFCVTGASPASIQAMEHALCQDGDGSGAGAMKGGVMLASEKVNGGFLSIGRLDEHARIENPAGELTPLPTFRSGPPQGKVYPSQGSIWFGEGYRIASIVEMTDQLRYFFKGNITAKLLVKFKLAGNEQRIVNNQKNETQNIVYGMFDQVILGTGRLNSNKELTATGSSFELVPGGVEKLEVINSDVGLPIGMQSSGNALPKIRMLGAAGLNVLKQTQSAIFNKIIKYENTLPHHARVNQEGVTLSGHAVAWANKFYTLDGTQTGPILNTNINTATEKELEKVVETTFFVTEILATRSYRIGPFIDAYHAINAIAVYRHWTQRRRDNGLEKEYLAEQQPFEKEIKRLEIELEGLKPEPNDKKEIAAKEELRAVKSTRDSNTNAKYDLIIGSINNDELLCCRKLANLDLIYDDGKDKYIKPLSIEEQNLIKRLIFRPNNYIDSTDGTFKSVPDEME
jgi:hypothetical protein